MDGTEALAALQAPGAPRVAILDWNMPGMTGMEIWPGSPCAARSLARGVCDHADGATGFRQHCGRR